MGKRYVRIYILVSVIMRQDCSLLAKTFNLNKVKITFPSSKFFELSKPPTYNNMLRVHLSH
jgi:hypothetical protein